jgi:hypothetical protein
MEATREAVGDWARAAKKNAGRLIVLPVVTVIAIASVGSPARSPAKRLA